MRKLFQEFQSWDFGVNVFCKVSFRRWQEEGLGLQYIYPLTLTVSSGCFLLRLVVAVQGRLRDICMAD